MSPEAIAYFDAHAQHDKATSRLNSAKTYLHEFLRATQFDDQKTFFKNTSVPVSHSIATATGAKALDAANWASAESLQERLNEVFAARQDAEALYRNLQEDEKRILPKLP